MSSDTTPFVNQLTFLDQEIRGGILLKSLPRNGNMVFKVISKPQIEPITVTEFKTFARIDGTAEDALIANIITAVRGNAEKLLGRSFIQQTLLASMDFWPGIRVILPRPPLISVTEIRTVAEDGSITVYDPTNYYVRTATEPGEVVVKRGVAVPINDERDLGGFEIELVGGYGSRTTDVPQGIRIGLNLWASTVYETRVIGPDPPPNALKALQLEKVIKI